MQKKRMKERREEKEEKKEKKEKLNIITIFLLNINVDIFSHCTIQFSHFTETGYENTKINEMK